MAENKAEEKKVAELYFGYNDKAITEINEDLNKLSKKAEQLNGKMTINVDSKSLNTLNANLDRVLKTYKLKVKEGAEFTESQTKSIYASTIKYANKAVIEEKLVEDMGNKQIEVNEKKHQNNMIEIAEKRRATTIKH